MKKKQMLATLVMLSLLQGSVYAAEFIGLNDEDLIQYDSRNDQFINHETNEIIPVENIDGLRTIEITFKKPIKDYDINFGQWTEVHDFPFDKAIINLEENLTLTNGNHLWVTDTDQIVEFNFAEGKEIYGEFDPNKYNDKGIITPDNTVGLTLNVDAIRLKVLDGYMEDQCGAIATRGNGWSPGMQPNSGTHINTQLLDIVSDNYTYSPDKTGIFVYNNLFNINTNTLNIYSTNEQTRFGNGIISANSDSNITADNIYIDAEAAIVVQDPMNNGDQSNLDITANTITLNGAVQAYGGNLTFVRDNNRANQKLSIIVNGEDAVTANTPDYPDFMAEDNKAILTFNVDTVISSQGSNTSYVNKDEEGRASAIRAMRNSIYNLNSADQKYEIYGDIIAARGEETSNIIGGQINIGGTGSIVKGDALAGNTGVIDIDLNNGSYEGRVDDYQDAKLKEATFNPVEFDETVENNGTVNMSLNNSTWNVRGQSWVTTLDGNDSTIDLTAQDGETHAIHIGTLTGSNTFVVNLNADKHEVSDMIYIGKGTDEQQTLEISNERELLNQMDVNERLRFATVAEAGGGFGDNYTVKGRGIRNVNFDIEYVDYNAESEQNESENNSYNNAAFGEVKPGTDYVNKTYGTGSESNNVYLVRTENDTPVVNPDEDLTDSGKTVINMSRANYKNAIYMDRLNKRLGEARYINGEEDQGMWVRLRHDRIGQSGDFRSMNTMYELGYDEKQDCDNGERRIGFAVDYMRGSTTYSDILGKGETKRYGLWLYDTWLGDKGHYADYVLKWGHLSNDFDIRDKESFERVTGDYSNNVFSASAEYGRKKDLGNDWYIEPQAQLQLARVTGAEYTTTTQDTKVSVDGINSLIGRAGFRLGHDLNERSTVYVKADLLHEFLGDQTITATDTTGSIRETFENKGTWYDIGFGFATALGKDSYAFMDFEKSFGNDNDETYQINAGVQWTF